MSSFEGKLVEYPYVSLDMFDASNLHSAIFFLSHFHADHIVDLDSTAFRQRLACGEPPTKLYTSETTRKLMQTDDRAAGILQYTVGLPVNQDISLTVHIPINKYREYFVGEELAVVQTEEGSILSEHLTVTLISAGHCVGSVMFLIDGRKGPVLYTGDFRLKKTHLSKIACLHSGLSVRQLRSVYVDTTFCTPNMPDLADREETAVHVCELISDWLSRSSSRHVVHLKCKAKYGYEFLLREVATSLGIKLHVDAWRMTFHQELCDMWHHFTEDKNAARVHTCYNPEAPADTLPCGLTTNEQGEPLEVLTIVPSSLWFLQNGVTDRKRYIDKTKTWRVFHSMHASYREIREFLDYLRPERIYPSVIPVDATSKMDAHNRLKDLEFYSDKKYSSFLLKISSQERTAANVEDCCEWDSNLICIGKRDVSHNLSSPPPIKRKRRKKRTLPSVVTEFTDKPLSKIQENTYSVPLTLHENSKTTFPNSYYKNITIPINLTKASDTSTIVVKSVEEMSNFDNASLTTTSKNTPSYMLKTEISLSNCSDASSCPMTVPSNKTLNMDVIKTPIPTQKIYRDLSNKLSDSQALAKIKYISSPKNDSRSSTVITTKKKDLNIYDEILGTPSPVKKESSKARTSPPEEVSQTIKFNLHEPCNIPATKSPGGYYKLPNFHRRKLYQVQQESSSLAPFASVSSTASSSTEASDDWDLIGWDAKSSNHHPEESDTRENSNSGKVIAKLPDNSGNSPESYLDELMGW